MELGEIIAGGTCSAGDDDCANNDCPTVALVPGEPEMIDVQGYHQPGISTPPGEIVARIPKSVLLEAARVLGR